MYVYLDQGDVVEPGGDFGWFERQGAALLNCQTRAGSSEQKVDVPGWKTE